MSTTKYVWDDETDTVVKEKDGSDTTQAVYHSDPVPYGRLFSMRRTGKTYDYRYDAQSNTRALSDETGQTTDTYRYDGWGNQREHSGTTTNPYRFGGQRGYQFDESNADYYVGQLVYRPDDGRWQSRVALRFANKLNPYIYTGNRPTHQLATAYLVAWAKEIHKNKKKKAIKCPVSCRESAKVMRDIGHMYITPQDAEVFHKSRTMWNKNSFAGANGISVGIHFKQSEENKKNKWCCCDGFDFIQFLDSNMRPSRDMMPVEIDGGSKFDPHHGTYKARKRKRYKGQLPPVLGLPHEMYDSPYVLAQDFTQTSNPKPGKVHSVTLNFMTCLVCTREKPKKNAILGCVHWGFEFKATRLLNDKRQPQLEGTVHVLGRKCSGSPSEKSPFRNQLEKQYPAYFKDRLAAPNENAPPCC